MNKPKSTTIEMDHDEIDAIKFVGIGRIGRVAYPGKFVVYREGGKVFLEVFHND